MTFEHTRGTRAQVWHGTAEKTSGGLTKSHLMMNKHGRIVSKKKHSLGQKSIKHLQNLGYKAKKGEFKLFHKLSSHKKSSHKKSSHKKSSRMSGGRRKSRKMSGGMALGGFLSPHSYDGQGVNTSGVDLQFVAGNSS